MRIPRTGLGQSSFDTWYCSLFGELADANGNCYSGQITSQTGISVPSGYASATPSGAIPSNPSGTTLVTTPEGTTVDPSAQLAANQAAEAQCQSEAPWMSWNPSTVTCSPNWILLIAGGAGLLLFGLLIARGGR